MSGIQHLCDHRAVVYRTTPDHNELGDNVDVWTALAAPAGLNARATLNESGNLEDRGPGEIQATMQRWFLVVGFDVAERDVLSVVSGPRAPVLLRVEKVIPGTHPLEVHHIEVDVTVWSGSVEPVEEEEES